MTMFAVFDAANNEYYLPEPDLATYHREVVGQDANGGPLMAVTATVTWRYGDDPDADGGILTKEQYGYIRQCIQAGGVLVIRTLNDAVDPLFVKMRGRSLEMVPGATLIGNLALGVLITITDCEAI